MDSHQPCLWHAGCTCSGFFQVGEASMVQVLDVAVAGGSADCILKVTAGSEVLVTAVYVVHQSIEDASTTVPNM